MPSMSDRPLIILTEHLDEAAIEWIGSKVDLKRCAVEDPDFDSLLAKAAGLLIRTYTIVDESLLARAPMLKVVGRAGVGLDNVDLKACAARGIEVVNTPDANTQAVVEYVTSMITDHLRPRTPLENPVDAEAWSALRDGQIAPRQMNEMTFGILGLGRIGSRMAEVAGAIGFRVIYNDIDDIPARSRHDAEAVDLDTLLEQSDVLTIHVDGRPSNHGFLGGDQIEKLSNSILLVNTSRGFVIDTTALADFLEQNPDAHAVLDVHEPEPVPSSNPLLGLPNAVLYPHLASRTRAAQANMSWVVRDVARVLGV
ncbi:MAG: hypothetical protein CMJ40_08830 [Phycisphaerae bacterium]|nr:hypothetical protein [Phycisphaerae bacterium]